MKVVKILAAALLSGTGLAAAQEEQETPASVTLDEPAIAATVECDRACRFETIAQVARRNLPPHDDADLASVTALNDTEK